MVEMVCKKKYVMEDKTVAFKKGIVYEFTRAFKGENYKGVSEVDSEHYISGKHMKKYFVELKGFKN